MTRILQVNNNWNEEIIGVWHQINDPDPNNNVEIEFQKDGQMTYSYLENEIWKIIILTYYLDGNIMVTNQPSNPKVEKTEFFIDEEGILSLKYSNETTRYRRGEKRTPQFS